VFCPVLSYKIVDVVQRATLVVRSPLLAPVSFTEVMPMAMALLNSVVGPFDPKLILLPKHAQHVVLIHFPIALFISAVGFDFVAHWRKRPQLAETAYYNLSIAAISTFPVILTGILAWHFRLEEQRIKGVLLLHLVLALVSSLLIWFCWWLHSRARRKRQSLPSSRLPIELLAVGVIAITSHLGGFLSGVNLPN
jgi:uncharacterized membrane protein